jgi:hypothetical protein
MKLSILTCVNDQTKYANCVMKTLMGIRKTGHEADVQIFDNTGNRVIVPVALNRLISQAESDLIVCIHQDVMLPSVWIDQLEEQIKEVEECWGTNWGVLGVFGVTMMGRHAGNIVDKWHVPPTHGLPLEAQSLDEVCLIFRKSSGLSFDESLGGNHMYGGDLCLQARQRQMPCVIIDDVLTHLGQGQIDYDFTETAKRFVSKWSYIGYEPQIRTTCGEFVFNV